MKVISDYLADLAIDLKITLEDEMSSTELTRCVGRAVADLTRFLPLQKSKEFIVDTEIAVESFTTPAASDPDKYVDNKSLAASVDGETVTTATTPALAGQTPDVPRPVMVTVTDDGTTITDLVIIVKGRDAGGNYIEEYFYLATMTTTATGYVQTGIKYFATITEVELEEIAGRSANDKLDVGTGTNFGVYVQLANKPIQFQSDAITSYTRYTHYIMDYYGGRIAMKDATSGDMVVATAYNIKYTKSKITVDLRDLDDLVRVESVEYPVGTVPQDMSTMQMWGRILTVTSSGMESQAEMSDEQHVLVHYLAQHQPPGASSSGTYPSFLDWTVELAASAYALFIRALQYEQAVATTLGYIGIGTASPTLMHKLIDDALDKIAVYLETNTVSGGGDASAEALLENITSDIALLRNAVCATGEPQTGALAEAAIILGEVTSIDLDAATVGAVAWLLEGELKIDVLTDGENVAPLFAEYAKTKAQIAQTRVQTALAYVQEAQVRLTSLRSYIEEAGAWMRMGEIFLAEAQGRIDEVGIFLAEAEQNQVLADRFREEAIERRNEAWAIWSSPPQYAPQYTLGMRRQSAS